jgi:acyl transferase domain-containing protein
MLDVNVIKFLQANNNQAKRFRLMLAQLYGAEVSVDVQAFFKQASQQQMQAWLALQQFVFEDQFNDPELTKMAEEAKLEYQSEQAFDEGRKFAYSLPAAELVEYGQEWRKTKNPYLNNDLSREEIAEAWTDGFQNALNVLAGESW